MTRQLLLTILLSTGIVLLALTLLGIGWLITGRSRIIAGACGMNPDKKRNKKCGTREFHCDLCDGEGEKTPSDESQS